MLMLCFLQDVLIPWMAAGVRPVPAATLAQAQRESQGPQEVLQDIARRPNQRRPQRSELQSLGLSATAQTCWGTASGTSADLAWLSNPAVKSAYTRYPHHIPLIPPTPPPPPPNLPLQYYTPCLAEESCLRTCLNQTTPPPPPS